MSDFVHLWQGYSCLPPDFTVYYCLVSLYLSLRVLFGALHGLWLKEFGGQVCVDVFRSDVQKRVTSAA